MGSRLTQTQVIAIALSIVVFALVLYMLVKIAGKRFNVNGGRVNRRHGNKTWSQKSAAKFHIVLPEFPYATLSESAIQPEIFNQTPEVIIPLIKVVSKSVPWGGPNSPGYWEIT